MKHFYKFLAISVILCFLGFQANAHDHALLKGIVTDSVSGQAIAGASVNLNNGELFTLTNAFGVFHFPKLKAGAYKVQVTSLGFIATATTIFLNNKETHQLSFALKPGAIMLSEITIAQPVNNQNQAMLQLNQIDKELRPINSGQDLLRLVPGLFIAQHAGGGKAEQIFIRGFDVDHGTDFAVSVDGIPVNMVSHAHGQGYADFHFVIPETIDALQVYKGPYHTRFGNFATTGAGAFSTKNALHQSQIKLEGGRFNTYRALAMIDLLGNRHLFTKDKQENAYIAAEYLYSDAHFEAPQHLKRFNIFGKYTGQVSKKSTLSFSASTFKSSWDASGQIPQRAVDSGIITRFGSIDNSEGGSTDRTNINAILTTTLPNQDLLTNQFYFSNYHFDLSSNFTFFLNDSLNGDGIRQKETGRNIYGYNATYEKQFQIGSKNLTSAVGIGTRIDDAGLGLFRAVRRTVIDTVVTGELYEQNAFAFTDHTLELTEKLLVNAGLRFDYFEFKFNDQTTPDLSGSENKLRISPKLNLFYQLNSAIQLFAKSGIGFHSNDARGVVANKTANVLPKAVGYEVGSTFKLTENLLVNAALWHLDLENELIYVGDEGIVEISGPTRRFGTDLSLRYQISKLIFADTDLNFNYGRLQQAPEGENYIPLAPSFTSIGGITLKQDSGLNASLRYRYIDSRPANETNSVQAKGYFLIDAVANYTWPKVQFGITAENLLNAEWNEAQFDTESRLQNETEPISELHFTPGTPFFIKARISYLF